MATPVNEKGEPLYPTNSLERKISPDDEHTAVDSTSVREPFTAATSRNHLTVNTDYVPEDPSRMLPSPSQTREQQTRLQDNLQLLQAERDVTEGSRDRSNTVGESAATRSLHKSRSRHTEPGDDFDIATKPYHERGTVYKPPEDPTTKLAKFFKKVHNSSFLVRWFTYIVPLTLLLLIPLLVGQFAFPSANVGGVKLVWFSVWLEIFWLSFWAGRILAKLLPWPIGLVASLFTNNDKKWRDMGRQLEIPATLFLWWLAILVSFLPTVTNHHIDGNTNTRHWEIVMNKVLIAFFVGFTLNFITKIIIQLIAISFHLRTYQDRIEVNKFQIESLVQLYTYSKRKIEAEDSEFEAKTEPPSGARTPGQYLDKAQKATRRGLKQFGDVAGKIAQDVTGRQFVDSGHPHQVVLALLSNTTSSQALARRLWRTFIKEGLESIEASDLKEAFENDEQADAAFTMFDRDLNGDITMEELEAVCVEIGRERKAITASLKNIDSVISKLDDVFMFIVAIIVLLVFVSLISTSTAGVLTSLGSTVLGLSWLFAATAQEFLQSIIFVFVKHPYDVGDRVGVYASNVGGLGRGDDYYVKEIALLYTEFKKMEGHVVQAPNSLLNTIFILNHHRSGPLAEAVPVTFKYGTTLAQLETLRNRLVEYVTTEKRDFQPKILTEMREVTDVHSLTMNVVFFYKSSWQNELLRLQRRNKFIIALTVVMQECKIEGPQMRYPGMRPSFPMYLSNQQHVNIPGVGVHGNPDNPMGIHNPYDAPDDGMGDPPFVPEKVPEGSGQQPDYPSGAAQANQPVVGAPYQYQPSLDGTSDRQDFGTSPPATTRRRGESFASMNQRVDFSLGMQGMSSSDDSGDVYDDRIKDMKALIPPSSTSQSRTRTSQDSRREGSTDSKGIGRSTSFGPGKGLKRVFTDGSDAVRMRQSHSIHRNRFFDRSRRHAHFDEESGRAMQMADIPEAPHSGQQSSGERLDPRSGLVSPAAMRLHTDESVNAAFRRTSEPPAPTSDVPRAGSEPWVTSPIDRRGHVSRPSTGGSTAPPNTRQPSRLDEDRQ